jgi:hypothetical protein
LTQTSVENWFGYEWHFLDVWFPNVPGTFVRFEKKLAKRISAAAFPGMSFGQLGF